MSGALVGQWLSGSSTYDLASEVNKPHFVVLRATSGLGDVVQIFKRSTSDSWAGDGFFGRFAASSTSLGGVRLQRSATARVVRPAIFKEGVLIAPLSALSAMRYNQSAAKTCLELVTGRTPSDWQVTRNYSAPFPAPGIVLNNATGTEATFDSEAFQATENFKAVVKAFAGAGLALANAPKLLICPTVATQDETGIVSRAVDMFGTGKVIVWWSSSASSGAENDTRKVVCAFEGGDLSFGAINSFYLNQAVNIPSVAGNGSVWLNGSGIKQTMYPYTTSAGVVAFSGEFNAAYAVASNGEQAAKFGIQFIDDYWLPLMSTPGNQELFFRSAFAATHAVHETFATYDVTTVKLTGCDVAGVMPVSWYTGYVERRVEDGVQNQEALDKAVADMAPYLDKDITFVAYPTPVMLPVDLIKQTELYQDYKEAKEKACEENDFMSKEFVRGMTYGNLNTLINGSRSVGTFYGYRDANQRNIIAPVVDVEIPYLGFSIYGVSDPLIVKNKQNVQVESIGFGDVDALGLALSKGASFKDVSIEAVASRWGQSPTVLSSQVSGMSATTSKIGSLGATGPTASVYDFRWGSVGITGIPDYKSATPQDAFQIAMISKGVVGKLGLHYLNLLLSELQSEYTKTLLPLSTI